MRVHNIMIKNPITVQPDTPVREVAQLMRDKGISSVIITDENKPIGIIIEENHADEVASKFEGWGYEVEIIQPSQDYAADTFEEEVHDEEVI